MRLKSPIANNNSTAKKGLNRYEIENKRETVIQPIGVEDVDRSTKKYKSN